MSSRLPSNDDPEIYLVLNDFGGRLPLVREHTDRETVITDLIAGHLRRRTRRGGSAVLQRCCAGASPGDAAAIIFARSPGRRLSCRWESTSVAHNALRAAKAVA